MVYWSANGKSQLEQGSALLHLPHDTWTKEREQLTNRGNSLKNQLLYLSGLNEYKQVLRNYLEILDNSR